MSCEVSSLASGSGYATAVSRAPDIIILLAKISMSFGVKEQMLGIRVYKVSAARFALGEHGANADCFPCTNVLV